MYHTALPLSPGTSKLRRRFFEECLSWEQNWTTQQVSPWGLHDAWGIILTTIKADSGGFTHVAVAGEIIAAVCEDNTINVYGAVTGALRMSLNPPREVTKAKCSPDGSALFCAHRHSHEITLWDVQTGGLIHTFTTKFEISDIAVSLTGKYLASCSPYGDFRFWKVENRHEGARFVDGTIVSICWLEPEDNIALGLEGTVIVLEVTTGRTLHAFSVGWGVRGIAFSAEEHRLAVWSSSGIESWIAFIDTRIIQRMNLVLNWSPPSTNVCCFALSSNGVVCVTGTGHLRRLWMTENPPRWHDYLSHLGTIHSIDLLRGGNHVVNVGSSIQLLATGSARPSGESMDPGISHVFPLDDRGAICASSRVHGSADLLNMETMMTRLGYSVMPSNPDPSFIPRILCASLDRNNVILNFTMSGEPTPRYQVICSVFPEWETYLSELVLLAALSPSGGELVVVVESVDGGWGFHVVDALDGKALFSAAQAGRPPKNIAFTSKTEFYTEHEVEDCHEETPRAQESRGSPARVVPVSTLEAHSDHRVIHCVRKTFALNPRWSSGMIRKLSEEETLLTHPYELDKDLEWVVDAKSRRVCWLPPGHISGTENGHFFVDSSIVMAGQDGIVRKLTFREPRSDS